MKYREFVKQIWDAVEESPDNWRKGQKVFNVMEALYGDVARQVQSIDHVDCFYDDKQIEPFIDQCWIRVFSKEHPIPPRDEEPVEWGEEDERIRKWLVDYFSSIKETVWIHRDITCEQILGWLEKQKYDRMKPIYDARESFESALEKAWNDYHNGYENVDKLENDYVECAHAKGFREGYLFGIEKQKEQKPAEWSEEDREMRMKILKYLSSSCNVNEYEEVENWLNSLRPQPHTVSVTDATKFGNLEYERGVKDGIQSEKNRHWKPSKEQMQVLSETIAFAPDTFKPKCTLVTLQDDLKKLMEE